MVVAEYCNASYASWSIDATPTGACSSVFGQVISSGSDTQENWNGVPGSNLNNVWRTMEGWRYTIKDNPGTSFEVTCEPSASSGGNYETDATVSYQANATPLEILRNGQRLIGENRNVLPGEGISLSVAGADANTTHFWTRPPEMFSKSTLSLEVAAAFRI